MIESILESTKKNLGIEPTYTAFDDQITMHINSVFSTLQGLGVGPIDGYMIEGADETWGDFLADDPRYNQVRTYVYLRVRLMFDPPATSFAIASMNEQAKEMEWRMNVTREGDEWVHPDPPVELEDIIDGGYYAP